MASLRVRATKARLRRGAKWVVLSLAGFVAMVGIALLAGSFVPANRGWTQPRSGVTIFVYSNGVHSGLLLPAANRLWDWRGRVRARDLRDPRRAGTMLLFGWGDRDFYLNTPTWDDVDAGTLLSAMVGSGSSLIHVDHVRSPVAGPDLRPIVLTPAQYARLVRLIAADFAPGAAVYGYGADDAFYPARGRYWVARTCNEWTAGKLRAVGVRVGIWTPMQGGVMRWFAADRRG